MSSTALRAARTAYEAEWRRIHALPVENQTEERARELDQAAARYVRAATAESDQ